MKGFQRLFSKLLGLDFLWINQWNKLGYWPPFERNDGRGRSKNQPGNSTRIADA
jgi:hypothetical protein